MRVQSYWTLVLIITIIAAVAWAVVATLAEPDTGTGGVVLFFVSAGATICGFAMMVTLWAWCRGGRCARDHRRVLRALRHGILAGIVATTLIVMKFAGLFIWWTVLMVVGVALLVELYVILVKPYPKSLNR